MMQDITKIVADSSGHRIIEQMMHSYRKLRIIRINDYFVIECRMLPIPAYRFIVKQTMRAFPGLKQVGMGDI